MPSEHFFLVDKQGIVRGRWIGEDEGSFPANHPEGGTGNCGKTCPRTLGKRSRQQCEIGKATWIAHQFTLSAAAIVQTYVGEWPGSAQILYVSQLEDAKGVR